MILKKKKFIYLMIFVFIFIINAPSLLAGRTKMKPAIASDLELLLKQIESSEPIEIFEIEVLDKKPSRRNNTKRTDSKNKHFHQQNNNLTFNITPKEQEIKNTQLAKIEKQQEKLEKKQEQTKKKLEQLEQKQREEKTQQKLATTEPKIKEPNLEEEAQAKLKTKREKRQYKTDSQDWEDKCLFGNTINKTSKLTLFNVKKKIEPKNKIYSNKPTQILVENSNQEQIQIKPLKEANGLYSIQIIEESNRGAPEDIILIGAKNKKYQFKNSNTCIFLGYFDTNQPPSQP